MGAVVAATLSLIAATGGWTVGSRLVTPSNASAREARAAPVPMRARPLTEVSPAPPLARPAPLPPATGPRAHTLGTGAVMGLVQAVLVNEDRARAGLPALSWNACLARVAAAGARRMASQGYISHAGAVEQNAACVAGAQRTGENVGIWGGGVNDSAINGLFMASPDHRANILGPYRQVGVAWEVAPDGSAYIAVEFA